MNDLIAISNSVIGSGEIKTVNARDLHSFLNAKKDFSNWIKNRIEKYRFTEGVDFVKFAHLGESDSKQLIDYHLSLDMAKELSMVERNEKGKQARQYFIECERVVKEIQPAFKLPDFTNPIIAARAWADEVEQKQVLQITLATQAPLVQFAENVQASTKSIRIGDFVKLISNKTGFVIGRNNFFEWLRWEKILDRKNMPYQKYIDYGWFEVKESTYENVNTNGPIVSFTTLITGQGQISILSRFKKSDTFKKYLNKDARPSTQSISSEVQA